MINCKKCGTSMIKTMSFKKDREEEFFRCPKCRNETKHCKIINFDFCFGENINVSKHHFRK